MITPDVVVLLAGASTVAVVHTALGVDHYLPIAAVGRARGWSLSRTLRFTALCGFGHVGSALLLGALFAGLGVSGRTVLGFDAMRGDVVAWLLVLLGVGYAAFAYGRGRGTSREHSHAHGRDLRSRGAVALLLIFVVGPCEPLVPLIFAGGASPQWWTAPMVAIAFSAATLLSMLALTALCYRGLHIVRTTVSDRFTHALAGAAVATSGLLILGLGL
jgi:sulfite exporter TauE/SafE